MTRPSARPSRGDLELEHFGLQQDGFEQLVEAGLLERRDFDVEHVAAHRFDEHFVLQQFGADARSDWRRACPSC